MAKTGRMAYYLVNRKNPKTSAVERHLQIYLYSQIGKEQILDGAVRNSSIPRAYLSMTFDALVEEIKNFVMNGHNISLENFGSIVSTIRSRPSETGLEVNAENVKSFKFNFRPCSKMRRLVQPSNIAWVRVQKVQGDLPQPNPQP